uniref:USP domain-containing protein n=1 Tax=Parastrongyloides trichosuri TaxID=131310 RepID=A0A0N4ZQG6_PARTI
MTTDNTMECDKMDIDSNVCNDINISNNIDESQLEDNGKFKAVSRSWWIKYLYLKQSGINDHEEVVLSDVTKGIEGFNYVILPSEVVNNLIKIYGYNENGCEKNSYCDLNKQQSLQMVYKPIKKKTRSDDKLHKKLYRHPAALINFGNACYVNCALQLLYSIPQLKHSLEKELGYVELEGLKRDEKFNEKMLSNTIYDYALIFEDGIMKDEPVKTKDFKLVIDKATEMYVCGGQHDLEEFLNWVVDKMDEECGNENGGEIKKLFDSSSTLCIRCPNCQNIRNIAQPFKVLRLSLDPSKEFDTLSNLLENFSKPIVLDEADKWKCDKCEKKVCAEMTTTFRHLADVLIISVKRYTQTLMVRNKLFTKIEYPLHELIVDEVDGDGNVKPVKYQLQALAKHKGDSITSGHYTALVKYDNIFWYCNDEDIHLDKMTNNISKNAYIFVYVKIPENIKN